MAGCPFKNFEECPEHDKKGGCEMWLSYSANGSTTEAHVEGCSIKLTPLILIQQVNNLAVVAGEVQKVGAEVSAGRSENIKTGEAARMQLLALATGRREFVRPDYSSTMKIEE
jgi:hypothetical protein